MDWNMANMKEKNTTVNHPPHYTMGNLECVDVIIDWELDREYFPATALKYICRHKYKGKPIEDIKKAIWFLQKYVEILENRKK